MFIMIGAEPHTDWLASALSLDERGFVLTGRDLSGDNWPLEREPYPSRRVARASLPPATFTTAPLNGSPVRSAKDPS